MPRSPSLTISAVALEAGVSVVTISRAMNSPDLVSRATRERIAQVMDRLGYVPDLVARSLVTRRSGIVAVLVPTLTDPSFARTLEGLSNVLNADNLQVVMANTHYSPLAEERAVVALLGRRPDALALTGTTHTPTTRKAATASGVPVVEMWHGEGDPIDLLVGIDNNRASRRAVDHLIAGGRRRLAYVGRPTGDNERSAARQQGFRDALEGASLVIDPDLVIETPTSMEAGARVAERLLGRVDAIAFSGDDMAAGAFLKLRALGARIPEDIALVGFGDHPVASLLPGGLTTVRVDGLEIGARAARLLLAAIRGVRPAETRVDVGFELVVRGSSGH